MKNSIPALAILIISLTACTGSVAESPDTYRTRCLKCHGFPGKERISQTPGPDLSKSRLNFEQFTIQVQKGSKWDGKPPKFKKYERKQMPSMTGVTDSQIQTLFNYVHKKK